MRKALLLMVLVSLNASAGQIEQARELVASARHEQARELLRQAVREQSTQAEATLLLTRICNDKQEWKDGVELGLQAVRLLPESSEAHYEYAVALRIKMSKVCRVRAMFGVTRYKELLRKAIELDPGNVAARAEEIGFLVNAPTIAGGNHETAEQRIEELSKLEPNYAMQMRAGLDLARESPEEAVKLFRRIIAEGPGS